MNYPKETSDGERAVDEFIEASRSEFTCLEKADSISDMTRGIDLWFDIELEGKRYSGLGIDVKAMKSIRRGHPKQDKFHWLELQDVHGGNGSLYSYANFIAFETSESFIIVNRPRIVRELEKKLIEDFVPEASMALYRYYGRPGRKDVITLVETSWLREIMWKEVSKNDPTTS